MALELAILTLNIWGIPYISKDREIRVKAIGDALIKREYDLVALQEVWSENDYQILKNQTASVLPYSHYFYSGVVGSGLCVLSKHPIMSTFFYAWSVNGYVHKIQHGDWFGGKGVGLCKIAIGDKIVHFYTAHLHAEYDRASDIYMTHRIIQAYTTAQFIESTRGDSVLQILAGDLNTEPDDLAYSVLLNRAKLSDAYNDSADDTEGTNECAANTYTAPEAAIKAPAGKRIDYIMYRFGANVQGSILKYEHPLPTVIPGSTISYSDHEAVSSNIILNDISSKTSFEIDHINLNVLIKSLRESIENCNESLNTLRYNRKFYAAAATTIIVLLISIIDIQTMVGLQTVLLIMKILLCGVFFWSFFMTTIWHTTEWNSIYAAKLSMQLELQHLEQRIKE